MLEREADQAGAAFRASNCTQEFKCGNPGAANKHHVCIYRLTRLQVYALTFLHSVVTMFGMWTFAAAGMFEVKVLGAWQARALWPLRAARSVRPHA